MGEMWRESKITRRVGVNGKRRERRFLSIKDVRRILRRVISHPEKSAKTKCQWNRVRGKRTWLISLLTHALTYKHILLSCVLSHPQGILKKGLLLKSTSFPLLFSYSDRQELLMFLPARPSAKHRAAVIACRRYYHTTISFLKCETAPGADCFIQTVNITLSVYLLSAD